MTQARKSRHEQWATRTMGPRHTAGALGWMLRESASQLERLAACARPSRSDCQRQKDTGRFKLARAPGATGSRLVFEPAFNLKFVSGGFRRLPVPVRAGGGPR